MQCPGFVLVFILPYFLSRMMLSNWHDSLITWAVNRNYYTQQNLQRAPGVTNYFISPVCSTFSSFQAISPLSYRTTTIPHYRMIHSPLLTETINMLILSILKWYPHSIMMAFLILQFVNTTELTLAISIFLYKSISLLITHFTLRSSPSPTQALLEPYLS